MHSHYIDYTSTDTGRACKPATVIIPLINAKQILTHTTEFRHNMLCCLEPAEPPFLQPALLVAATTLDQYFSYSQEREAH